MKTTKYRKWCFDQIQGISEDNKELTAKVDQLWKLLEMVEKDQEEAESQRLNVFSSLARKSRKEQVTYLSHALTNTGKILLVCTYVFSGACCRPGGGSHQASSDKHTPGRGECPIISGECSGGRGPRTALRPVNENHRGGKNQKPRDNQ
jgi:hypothetical protein